MKVYIANSSKQSQGGGWSWISNFKKCGMTTDNYEIADIYLIPSASMISREEAIKAKQDGKKIVLRTDNVLRNSRNRNTGMTRLFDFAQMSDLVIFQSQWAKDYLTPFLNKGGKNFYDSPVILNSCDLDIFYPPSTQRIDYANNYLYSRFNRDETKNWEVARYWFSELQAIKKLHIVGNFSPELVEGNFDFYKGEQYQYYGSVSQEQMADIYRHCKYFIYTYFNDACSNSLIEALCSGCKIVGDNYYRKTGGAEQIIKTFKELGRDYFGLERMAKDYEKCLQAIV